MPRRRTTPVSPAHRARGLAGAYRAELAAMSLAEVGKRLGLTKERVRQIELMALRKMRRGLAELAQDYEPERDR